MNKYLKYSLKILGWLILGIIAVILLVSLLLQTGPVRRKIAAFAEKKVASFINGNLTVGEIGGNFFTNLTLKNVLITQKEDTLAFVAEIKISYNLIPLIYSKISVINAQIDHPYFFLKQLNDSTWNVQQIIKPSAPTADTTSTPFGFSIDVSKFSIVEGKVNIESADTLIPREIQHLNTALSMHYDKNKQSVQLDELALQTSRPDFQIKKLAFKLSRNTKTIELTGFYLKTARNLLNGKATYTQLPNIKGAANLEMAALQLDEFEFVLPTLKIPATPVIKLDVSLAGNSVNATIDLEDQDQRIHLDVASANLYDFLFSKSNSLLKYKLKGKLENIDLAYWLGDEKLNYLINGELTADGQGIDLETAVVDLKGDFKNSRIEDKLIDKFIFAFGLNQGDLKGTASGSANFGEFRLDPDIKNLQGIPTYRAALMTKRLNLAAVTGNDSLQSDINLKAIIKGRGYDPKTMTASASVVVLKSKIQLINLDTLFSELQYSGENLKIDSLLLLTKALKLTAHGNYSLRSASSVDLTATFSSIDEFASFIPVKDLHSSGRIDATLRGTPDSLKLQSSIALDQTIYGNYKLEQLMAEVKGTMTPADTLINAHLVARKLSSDAFSVDSINVVVDATPALVSINGQLANRDLKTQLQAGMRFGSIMKITLDEWVVDYKNQHWALQSPPAILEIDPLNYRIHNFRMASSNTDTAQFVRAEGNVSRKGEEKFELEAANIDIKKLGELFNMQMDASGLLGLTVNMTGTAGSPLIKGDFVLNNGIMNKYKLTKFDGIFGYQDNKLDLNAMIVPQDSGRIELTGTVPLHLKMDSLSFNFNPKDPVNVLLTVEKFPLAVLQAINLTDEITGYLDGEVKVTGTVESPDPKGNLKLTGASLKVAQYGVDYREIAFNVNFLRTKVLLEDFRIKTRDGDMKASGQVDFNSDFYKGDISQSEIKIEFHKFNPFDHRQFTMQLSGNASLAGKTGAVVFDGDLNIPKAEIYLPALMRIMGKMQTPVIIKPILVQEMEKMAYSMDTSNLAQIPLVVADSFRFDYFDRLKGKINIKIPKNAWIKNEDMRVEISGDLELIKNSDFFELFGSVKVVRGQYDLLGRTFIINEGTISFQGGEEMTPEMNLKASYTFRNSERVEQILAVNITGTAEIPVMTFTLNGTSINEGDAMSYILFGRGLDELSMAQQDNMGGGGLAEKAAASVLSSQLTKFLGNKLNVDYIELKSSGGFDNTTMTVGKYITNDLFVSYEQLFGQATDNDMTIYQVKLEYEVLKFLFLQLNNSSIDSGFDVIFKFDAE